MSEYWNTRYSNEAFAYGETPNLFFKAQLEPLIPGKILLPADGEGRNGVFAATLGGKFRLLTSVKQVKRKQNCWLQKTAFPLIIK